MQLNEEIRDKEVRVISADGEQLGIMSAKEALKKAEEKNLDLVKIAPQAQPPVCKIMDYGKYRYEQTKREKEQKKNQKIIEIKEDAYEDTIEHLHRLKAIACKMIKKLEQYTEEEEEEEEDRGEGCVRSSNQKKNIHNI